MKKGLLILFVMCTLAITTQAQNREVEKPTNSTVNKQRIANTALDAQLTKMFGKAYSLESSKVKAQLNKNIDNTKEEYTMRKLSMIALYGDKAYEKRARITKE